MEAERVTKTVVIEVNMTWEELMNLRAATESLRGIPGIGLIVKDLCQAVCNA